MNAIHALEELKKKKTPKIAPELLRAFYLRYFSAPTFPMVHIAGTNGKGSVSEKLRYACEKAGYRTGLFTSPHLHNFQERMQVARNMIGEDHFRQLYLLVEKIAAKSPFTLSFFTILFFMSIQYFSEKNVDIAILETGIGGRFDATNLFPAELSIITSIGYDHMDLLGDTLEQIAWEKAGIIRENTPVVLGPKARLKPLFLEAEKKNAPIILAPSTPCRWYDEENTLIAQAALRHLKIDTSSIENVRPPCRFEIVEGWIVLDIAHNAPGFFALFAALNTHFPNRRYRFVVCLTKGKEIPQVFPEGSFVEITAISHTQISSVEELKKCLHLKGPHHYTPHLDEALPQAAKSALAYEEVLVVTGSSYAMGATKQWIEENRLFLQQGSCK